MLINYVVKHGYLIKFDLRSGYHHIDIFHEHQSYLGFCWPINGQMGYFKFTVLPFGLSSACNIFTKVMRPLVKHWRASGIKVVLYLDDGITTSKFSSNLASQANQMKSDLNRAGFIINDEKSSWTPSHSL